MKPIDALPLMLGNVEEVNLIEVFLPDDTPLESVAANFSDDPYTVLLLSGGGMDSAEFSFLGSDPYLIVRAQGQCVQVSDFHETSTFQGNPFDILEQVVSALKIRPLDTSIPFYCGAMGYLSYELKNHLEALPRTCRDDLKLPELMMVFPRVVLVFDRSHGKYHLAVTDYRPLGHDGCYNLQKRVDSFQKKINQEVRSLSSYQGDRQGFSSTFTRQGYVEAVQKVREYVRQGDVYQVNLSQRFCTSFSGDSFHLFLDLFRRNPAPFFAYLNMVDHHVVSTSPEGFIYQQGPYVETRPIKGTRARGITSAEDEALKGELVASSKDEAELSMIVDLLRNDLGKVSAAGSVRVREHKRVEAYTNVFHLVSIVEGRLRGGCSQVDLIKAVFPGGSITGCPKIRAMEIIDELEPSVRSVYTGSIGYISLHDTMALNIAIRTAIIKDSYLYFSVGGGIVYDSNEEEEYVETLHKARTLMDFLGGPREEQGDVCLSERSYGTQRRRQSVGL